jgi:hypothetical protein
MEEPVTGKITTTTRDLVTFVINTFDRADWVPALAEQMSIAMQAAHLRGRAEAFAEAAQLAERVRPIVRSDSHSSQLALRAAIAVAIRELAEKEPPPL